MERGYISLYKKGELEVRVKKLLSVLESCGICPHRCNVNRLKGEKGICMIGRFAKVSSYFAHFGEEKCLRGWNGSGTIFFTGCNLLCVFCQNYDISHYDVGEEASPEFLADIMINLQELGCHNINFVTPTHVIAQIVEALPIAIEKGLNLPLVYNSGGYDSIKTLRLLDGIIDIYMPDFKFWKSEYSSKYTKAKDYPEVAKEAIKEMYRQVGDLQLDENGIATKGLLVRHLIMPANLSNTQEVMNFLYSEVSPNTYVNLMTQYYPAGEVNRLKYPELLQVPTVEEYSNIIKQAMSSGIHRFDK